MSKYPDVVNSLLPIAYLRLGEAVGETVAVDETGNYNGTYVNTPTLAEPGLLEIDADTAVEFDGIDQYIELDAIDLTDGVGNDKPISFSFIVKLNAIGSGKGGLISKWLDDTDLESGQFQLTYNDTGIFTWQFISGTIANRLVGTTLTAININTVYNIVLTYDGSETYDGVTLYLDGAIVTTTNNSQGTYSGMSIATIDAPLTIGAALKDSSTYYRYLDGTMDEVAIHDVVLTQQQVTDLYRASKAYAFDITIDHTKISEDLYNFPVLINLDTDSGVADFDTSRVFDELDRQNVDDDFTGTDGDAPDAELWEVLLSTPGGLGHSCEISDNSLVTSVTAVTSDVNSSFVAAQSLFTLSGDFDIEVDISSIRDITTSVSIHYFFSVNGINFSALRRSNNVLSWWSSTEIARSSDYGSMRFVRSGSNMDLYYKDSNHAAWTLLTTKTSIATTDAYVKMMAYTDETATSDTLLYCKWDNLKVNSGTIVWDTLPESSTSKILASYQPQNDTKVSYTTEAKSLSPIAYWRLGEAVGETVAVDEMGNYDGTYVGSPTLDSTGLLVNDTDRAVIFDGTGLEYVTIPNLAFSGDVNISISAIIKPQVNLDNRETIFGFGEDVAGKACNFLTANVANYGGTGLAWSLWGSVMVAPFTWDGLAHSAIATYDGANRKIYIDGDLKVTTASSLNVTNLNYRIGSTPFDATPTLDGTIDEVMIFDYALTQDQVTRLYNNSIDIQPTYDSEATCYDDVMALQPVAYWRLGESVGETVAVDETGNYDGTYVNSPTLESTGLLVGDVDTAVAFNGVNEHIEGSIAGFRSNDSEGTIVVIFNTSLLDTAQSIFGSADNANDGNYYYTYLRPDGKIVINVEINDVYNGIRTVNTFNDGDTHLAIITSDGSSWKIYVDGIEQEIEINGGINNGDWFGDVSNRDYFNIGTMHYNSDSFASYFNGTIDEVSIFDYALTQDQVTRLYNTSLKPQLPISTTSQSVYTEIDRWDQVNQQAQLWARIPYISKDVDTKLNLSFNKDNTDNSEYIGITGTTPAKTVWSEYDAVYHLSADGADSAANSLDGTLVNIDGTNIVDFGIGKGMAFDGIDEYIDTIPTGIIANIAADFSVSFAFNFSDPTFANGAFQGVLTLESSLTSAFILFVSNHVEYADISFGILGSTTHDIVVDTTIPHKLTITYSGGYLCYLDGVPLTINAGSNYGSVTNTTVIGKYNAENFTGTLKEIELSKNLKTSGWIASSYESTQDTLASYTLAESLILTKFISGTITESLPITRWLVRSYLLSSGILVANAISTDGTFSLNMPIAYHYPQTVTVTPYQGDLWVTLTAYAVDDLVFPIDPITTPYYYKCTVSGTSGSTEPTWPTSGTVSDGTVTWEFVSELVQPITHSPLIPV